MHIYYNTKIQEDYKKAEYVLRLDFRPKEFMYLFGREALLVVKLLIQFIR